jgi:hypothetical protein
MGSQIGSEKLKADEILDYRTEQFGVRCGLGCREMKPPDSHTWIQSQPDCYVVELLENQSLRVTVAELRNLVGDSSSGPAAWAETQMQPMKRWL